MTSNKEGGGRLEPSEQEQEDDVDKKTWTLGTKTHINGKSPLLLLQGGGGSATTGRRKPVPTPRNTLKKKQQQHGSGAMTMLPSSRRKSSDRDSQGHTSIDSTSPDENSSGGTGERTTTTTSNEEEEAPPPTRPQEDAEDILAALEKIPGVGSLRSVAHSSSIGSSLPSLSLNEQSGGSGGNKVKREESSHSLRSQLSEPSPDSNLLLRRQLDHNSKRSSTMATRPTRFNPSDSVSGFAKLRKNSSATEETGSSHSPASSGRSGGNSPDKKSAADHENNYFNKTESRLKCVQTPPPIKEEALEDGEKQKEEATDPTNQTQLDKVQTRPLPEVPKYSPLISADDISVISNSNSCKPMDNKFPGAEEEEEGGFYSQLISPDHYTELKTLPQSTPRKLPLPQIPKEASARSSSRDHQSESCSLLEPQAAGGYLTLTGTLRKGRKKPEECVYNIEMSLTRDHLSKIEKKVHAKYHDRCFCGLERGIHIFLLTLLCGPFLWILFTFQALYLGTLTWYNVFLHYNEERSCCHKLLSPLVLLIYPLWIIPVTLVLGLYGGLAQISWYYDSWIKVLRAPDGGFFGWVCNFLDTPECSPYQVILLSAQDYERPPTGATCL